MTYLRHLPRHVQQSVIDRIHDGLDEDGWLDDPAIFGTSTVRWFPARVDESTLTNDNAGNVVAVSFGTEPTTQEQELGGGLMLYQYTLYVDVVGVDDSISLAIAADIIDRLRGQKPDTSPFEPLYDYTTSPRTETDGYLEFVNVQRTRPEGDDYRRLWNMVVASVDTYVTGNE